MTTARSATSSPRCEDLAKNRDALIAMGAPSPRTHAYPYGETTTETERRPAAALCFARAAFCPGLNVGRADLAQLRAFPLFGDGGSRVRAAR